MHEINRVLSAAAWRLGVANFFKGLVYMLGAIVLGLILARIVQQVFGLAFDWKIIGYSCGGAALLGALVWSIMARPSRAAVARRVDEGANLKESLSTALSVEKSEDPWARVTVESAVRQARGVSVAQAVPIAAPRFWPVPLALGLAFAVVWMALPRMDVLGWTARKVAEEKKSATLVQFKADKLEIKRLEDKVEKLGLDKDKIDAPATDRPEPRTPEEARRLVLKDLTRLQERIEQLRNGEKGQKLDAVQDALKNLKTPGEQTSELAKALANSNFEKAQKELEKMKDAMANTSMDEKAKKDLADQLDNLAKQMQELAKNKEQLENAMKKAGLDPQAAKDPEAAKKEIEKAQNLTPEQKQQLKEMAQACGQCQTAMDGLSKACSQMAQASKDGDQQAMDKAAGEMQNQLSQLEQLKQEMDLADAAKNECQSKMASMCEGDKDGQGEGQCKGGSAEWSANWCNGEGDRADRKRQGGGGIGKGGVGDSAQADFEKTNRKDIGFKGSGPIVSSRLVEGESIKGESHADFVAAITKAEQSSTEEIDTQVIPREFHDVVKNYFGNLKKGVKGTPAKDAAPSAPAKPAEPAKDAGK